MGRGLLPLSPGCWLERYAADAVKWGNVACAHEPAVVAGMLAWGVNGSVTSAESTFARGQGRRGRRRARESLHRSESNVPAPAPAGTVTASRGAVFIDITDSLRK